MHDSLHISAYTPSNTDPEILEDMFVQRHKLLGRTVAWCVESIMGKKKNHLMFIGPRGSGKTHFISMVVNRLRDKTELQNEVIIIWLGEDDVMTSFIDLVLAILEKLVQTNPEQFNKDCLQLAKGQPVDTVVDIILHSITEQIADKTILLVKENMNDVFTGLKDDGQKNLRAYLQEKNNISILASSQQLFPGIASRDAAFFGFFDTHHLKVLKVDEAKQLISKIATLNKNQDLVDFLQSPQGCYRVRALHHLAGGNHRLYVELAAFLTMESLDDFVSAITNLADNLTPYFQERIRSLPPQQGKIVQRLSEMQGAIPVKTIAEETFIGERSVAKQLGDLARKGYVISHKRGKQSYYEMAEPLMRFALEAKNSHGQPLRMVASLLRVWFSDAELQIESGNKGGLLANYKVAALSIDKDFLVAINNKINEQIKAGFEANDYAKVIAASNEIINAPEMGGIPLKQKQIAFLKRGQALYYTGDLNQACESWTALIEMPNASIGSKAMALLIRSVTYRQKGDIELSLQDLTALIELPDAPVEQIAMALLNRSVMYSQKGYVDLGLQDLTALIELPDAPVDLKAKALFNRSVMYSQKGDIELVLKDLSVLINLPETPQDQLNRVLFFVPEAYFLLPQTKKAQHALSDAFIKGEKSDEYYPSNTQGILRSINQLGSSFWQKQIIWILDLYAKYEALDSLGSALIQSISFFIEDESLRSSCKKWHELWQEHGAQYPQMQLPLQVLNAAVLALEQGNDKPLLSLPKEVRDLVMPLVEKALVA